METTLATVAPTLGTFRQLTTKKGNPGGRVLEFFGQGITSISGARKALRTAGMSAKDARNLVNAELKGDSASVAKIKARTMIEGYFESGFIPTVLRENSSGSKATLVLEEVKGKTVNPAVALAAKNEEIANKDAEIARLTALLAAPPATALPEAAE